MCVWQRLLWQRQAPLPRPLPTWPLQPVPEQQPPSAPGRQPTQPLPCGSPPSGVPLRGHVPPQQREVGGDSTSGDAARAATAEALTAPPHHARAAAVPASVGIACLLLAKRSSGEEGSDKGERQQRGHPVCCPLRPSFPPPPQLILGTHAAPAAGALQRREQPREPKPCTRRERGQGGRRPSSWRPCCPAARCRQQSVAPQGQPPPAPTRPASINPIALLFPCSCHGQRSWQRGVDGSETKGHIQHDPTTVQRRGGPLPRAYKLSQVAVLPNQDARAAKAEGGRGGGAGRSGEGQAQSGHARRGHSHGERRAEEGEGNRGGGQGGGGTEEGGDWGRGGGGMAASGR